MGASKRSPPPPPDLLGTRDFPHPNCIASSEHCRPKARAHNHNHVTCVSPIASHEKGEVWGRGEKQGKQTKKFVGNLARSPKPRHINSSPVFSCLSPSAFRGPQPDTKGDTRNGASRRYMMARRCNAPFDDDSSRYCCKGSSGMKKRRGGVP